MEPKNVTRSKRLIKNAVMQLLLKKNPSDIKVTEITSLAEINRGTFYAHYNTVFDVISEIEDDIINKYLLPFPTLYNDSMEDILAYVKKTLYICHQYQENIIRDYTRNLLPNLTFKLKERIYHLIIQNADTLPAEMQLDYKIHISHMVSGYVGLITDWANGCLGKDVTPEDIFSYVKRMLLSISESAAKHHKS